MKILIVHNKYGKKSGEEIVVDDIQRLLNDKGHETIIYSRSSDELDKIPFGKFRAFFSGIYSFSSRNKVRDLLKIHQPQIVHIHNLFPLISPSILPECRLAGIPIVMTAHNYRLVCPNGLQLVNGIICEKCNKGKEFWCIINNCTGSYLKSLGYALRNYTARKKRFFMNNVTEYVTLSEFQKTRLIADGYKSDMISVIPNMVDKENKNTVSSPGDYVGYIGRISPEKGLDTLAKAAQQNPELTFKLAGTISKKSKLHLSDQSNLKLIGFIENETLNSFYKESKFIVLPSICYETFGLVVVEAMLHGKAVICSRIGGLPEIVDDGVTGLLFEAGNSEDLSKQIRYLWKNPKICEKMGQAGRKKALQNYSQDKYYQSLMSVYNKAIKKKENADQ